MKAVREQFPGFTRATGSSRLSICKGIKAVEQSMCYNINSGRETTDPTNPAEGVERKEVEPTETVAGLGYVHLSLNVPKAPSPPLSLPGDYTFI